MSFSFWTPLNGTCCGKLKGKRQPPSYHHLWTGLHNAKILLLEEETALNPKEPIPQGWSQSAKWEPWAQIYRSWQPLHSPLQTTSFTSKGQPPKINVPMCSVGDSHKAFSRSIKHNLTEWPKFHNALRNSESLSCAFNVIHLLSIDKKVLDFSATPKHDQYTSVHNNYFVWRCYLY